MTPPPYCPFTKWGDYCRLLRFARISGNSVPNDDVDARKALCTALDSFINPLNPLLRPLLPLIYRNSRAFGIRDFLSPKTAALLKAKTFLLVADELANRHWLDQHGEKFQKSGIPFILLKGQAFAGTIYPQNAPRPGVDLDILVAPEAFEAATLLLCETMQPVLLSTKRAATHDTLFERIFFPQNGSKPTVELHRDLTNPYIFNIKQQDLWKASRKHPAFDSELVRILSPEDTLLHLAVHAFRDLNFCTHTLLDAHEVWCQWQPESETLLKRAADWGAGNVLFYLLGNCKDIMETPIPETVLHRLQPAALTDAVNTKILRSPTVHNAPHTSFPYRILQLIGQLTFPDSLAGGVKFQLSYARTRLNDWLRGIRSSRDASS